MDNLEELLQTRDFIKRESRLTNPDAIKKVHSEKGTSMYGLISMIQKIVSLAMKDIDVELIPDEGKIPIKDPSERIDRSYITYKVVSRKIKKELKPRHREEFLEKTIDKQRIGNIYGQKFECVLQFNIFSSVYEQAELVMERFEEAIFSYSGFLKKNGVGEVYFLEQRTDESLDIFRQSLSIRSIQYYIEIEKTTKIYENTIDIIGVFDKDMDTPENTKESETNEHESIKEDTEDETIKDIIIKPIEPEEIVKEEVDKDLDKKDENDSEDEVFFIDEVVVSDVDYSGIPNKKR